MAGDGSYQTCSLIFYGAFWATVHAAWRCHKKERKKERKKDTVHDIGDLDHCVSCHCPCTPRCTCDICSGPVCPQCGPEQEYTILVCKHCMALPFQPPPAWCESCQADLPDHPWWKCRQAMLLEMEPAGECFGFVLEPTAPWEPARPAGHPMALLV